MKYNIGDTVRIKSTKEIDTIENVDMHQGALLPYLLKNRRWIRDSEIEPIERSIEDIQEGDLIVDHEGYSRRILGVCGKAVFVTNPWREGEKENSSAFTVNYSIQEIKNYGWKLVTETSIPNDIQKAKELLESNGYRVEK